MIIKNAPGVRIPMSVGKVKEDNDQSKIIYNILIYLFIKREIYAKSLMWF